MAKSSKREECVYVIGAGFSAGLGYPLTSDLLVRLWERIGGKFQEDLTRVIRFHHPGFDPTRFSSFPNVEQLLSEMLVNEELFDASRQYEGRFTRQDLRDLQRDLLLKIAEWFHELAKGARPSEPKIEWLKKFADRVRRENAAIISFNWDLILDELLFGDELDAAAYGLGEERGEHPILLKPHGSLNWFEENPGRHLTSTKRIEIFDSVYAFQKFRAPNSKHGRVYTPLIVPPVYLKDFDKPIFVRLWKSCTSILSRARKVVFVGYSMPAADLHAQFIMRCGFHNQVEGELGKDGQRATATGPAKVLIVNPDRGAAQRIEAVAGPRHSCRWISTPVAEWIQNS